MEYTLRPLSTADLERLAEIHCRAFPNGTLSRLGQDILRRYYRWQLLGPHQVSSLGIENDTGLLAFCLGGTFQGAHSGFVRQNRLRLLWSILRHPGSLSVKALRARIIEKVLQMFHAPQPVSNAQLREIKTREFTILAIAVDPACTRLGCGRILMNAMEQIALERGYSRMRLAVNPENLEALRFYLHLGWSKPLDFGPCRNVIFKDLAEPAAQLSLR